MPLINLLFLISLAQALLPTAYGKDNFLLGKGSFSVDKQGKYDFYLLAETKNGETIATLSTAYALDETYSGGEDVPSPNSSCKDELECRMPDGQYLVTVFCPRVLDFQCRSWKNIAELRPRKKFPVDLAGGILFLVISMPGPESLNSKFKVIERLQPREAKFDGDRIPERQITWGNIEWTPGESEELKKTHLTPKLKAWKHNLDLFFQKTLD